jgi:regulator of sigma E protease
VDGHVVTQFAPPSQDSVKWRIITSEGTNIAIKYLRDGQEHTAYPVPYIRPNKWYERRSLRQVLMDAPYPAVILGVMTNSPASLAGLQANDEVIALNGERIYSPLALMYAEEMLTNGPVKPVTLTIRRGQEEFQRTITAEQPIAPAKAGPSFGIVGWVVHSSETLAHPRPAEQIRESAGQIFATLNTVFSRKSDVGVQQLGGAVMIIRAYKSFFDSENGWRRVLWFSVILNVNLAMLNLLPLPVLDGGHILLALIEVIRRRPVSPRLLNYIQSGFAVMLIGFMLFIAFYDIGDWVRSARSDREPAMVFAPKK